jgi:predicted metal-dependent phosphoesterase TrpH
MTKANFRADLHCHSTASDGSLTPKQLIDVAIDRGLSGLSITDHDTIAAYQEALPYAREKGLPLLVGVEFSTLHDDTSVHLLAYSFQMDHPHIEQLATRQKNRRLKRNMEVVRLITNQGMPLTYEEVLAECDQKGSVVGRPHIALAMIKKGYVRSIKEAFAKYLGDNKSCFIKSSSPSAQETIQLVHEANGFVLIAHPHLLPRKRLLNSLLQLPLDGLEASYAKMSNGQNRTYQLIAKERNWFSTGGSDFHGDRGYPLSLGDSWTDEATFRKLLDRFYTNNAQWTPTPAC